MGATGSQLVQLFVQIGDRQQVGAVDMPKLACKFAQVSHVEHIGWIFFSQHFAQLKGGDFFPRFLQGNASLEGED